ncbi:hypothetical protein BBK36DRAFT_1112037 [Trichoderma citrinoviride]|uniref:Uncharacterized protein n=1 Tax=Trichoderma citrinoviride TaxID=58853 RepID=A0A2T4BHK1_9HYPO|nr:hypothetical protein BBK36DRAFT_1112037 [Trichoderma citrinoviride]PTB68795.1 hypothetical protein BBK36DRAFT_1112037 [Trichoderma citrinoviride]
MPLGDKPRQPQLSAGAARGMTRTPLTPKVAVKGPPATTPLARKSSSVLSAQSSPRGESAGAPPASYLSHTSTPRSGARQTRAESTVSTSSTNLDKMSDGGWDTRSNRGLGVSPLARSDSLSSRRSVNGPSSNSPGDDSKFFYASSVKPAAQAPPPRPASVVHTKSTPTFFYASDAASKRVTSPPAYPSSSTHSLASAQEGVATKFFYANGAPDVEARLSARSSGSGSTISSSSRATRANTSNSSAVGSSTTQIYSRPASPSKNLTHPTLPQQQHAQPTLRASAMSPTSPIRASAHQAPKLAATTAQANKRRVSIEQPLRLKQGHGRAGSVVSVEGGAAVPKIASPTSVPPTIHAPDMTPPLLSPGLAQLAQPMTMASILQMADEMDDEDEDDEGDGSEGEGEDGEDGNSDDSETDSISRKRNSQNSEPLDHLVLSARRERKVQDLEITNASLEAINRTLERQLRKQSAELRRFRRLSRAGRLGSAASGQGGASLTVPDAAGSLTDVSEREEDAAKQDGELEEDEDDEDEEDEEDEDSLVDSELSHGNTAADPNSTTSQSKAESPGDKRRKRDERRLQLDLTRHQELLLDSQKMNQSLKKCLDWTEVLIKEGQKALAYQVRISDVDAMPGRVLAASYYDYRDDTSQVEDDTISTVSASRFDDDTVSGLESEGEAWPKESQDRDSGIALRAAGH